MNRLIEVVFPAFCVEAGTEDVTAVADTEEDSFTEMYTDTLTEVAVEAVETLVTDEVVIELKLVKIDADVAPEEVGIELTSAVVEPELGTRTDDAT